VNKEKEVMDVQILETDRAMEISFKHEIKMKIKLQEKYIKMVNMDQLQVVTTDLILRKRPMMKTVRINIKIASTQSLRFLRIQFKNHSRK